MRIKLVRYVAHRPVPHNREDQGAGIADADGEEKWAVLVMNCIQRKDEGEYNGEYKDS